MCKTLVYISIAKGSGTTMAVSSFSKKDAINCVTLSSLSVRMIFSCHTKITFWAVLQYNSYKLQELDRAYSPSLWNNRGLSSEETIQRHVSTTLKGGKTAAQITSGSSSSIVNPSFSNLCIVLFHLESKKAAVELYSKINVQYGSTPKSVLDLYSSSPLSRLVRSPNSTGSTYEFGSFEPSSTFTTCSTAEMVSHREICVSLSYRFVAGAQLIVYVHGGYWQFLRYVFTVLHSIGC